MSSQPYCLHSRYFNDNCFKLQNQTSISPGTYTALLWLFIRSFLYVYILLVLLWSLLYSISIRHLCTCLTVGLLLSEPRQLAGTMISFFQQFNQYLSYDTAPIPPTCCQEVLTRLTVTSEPNKVQWLST